MVPRAFQGLLGLGTFADVQICGVSVGSAEELVRGRHEGWGSPLVKNTWLQGWWWQPFFGSLPVTSLPLWTPFEGCCCHAWRWALIICLLHMLPLGPPWLDTAAKWGRLVHPMRPLRVCALVRCTVCLYPAHNWLVCAIGALDQLISLGICESLLVWLLCFVR